MPRVRQGLFLVIALAISISACSSSERPDAATWLPSWEAMVAVIPAESDLGDPPSEDLCQSTLADIRTQNSGLLPSPSITVDDLVTEWVAVAEAAFFDCPPEGEDIDSFSDAYEELQRIEDSVDAALADTGS